MKKVVMFVVIFIMCTGTAFPADFLRSPRGGGMGFSYFVLADDPSGSLYNPAGLGYTKGWQTQFMYDVMTDHNGYVSTGESPYTK